MLSIGKVRADGMDYYTKNGFDREDFEYPSGAGQDELAEGGGRWIGPAMAAYGLDPDMTTISSEELERVLTGHNAVTGDPLAGADARAPKREHSVRGTVQGASLQPGTVQMFPSGTAGKAAARAAREALGPDGLFRRAANGRGWTVGMPEVDVNGDVVQGPIAVTKDRKAVVGIDMTFSAPKSVSVVGILEPAAVRRCQEAAVETSMAWGGRWFGWARAGVNSGVEPIEATIGAAAMFTHTQSRNGDPQLHTHVIVPNKVLCTDGVWRALDARTLYSHAATLGTVYQAALRAGLTRELGVAWTEVDQVGFAEIQGVDPELIELWSSRSTTVDTLTESVVERAQATRAAAGRDGLTPSELSQIKQAVVLKSRPSKEVRDLAARDGRTLTERWTEQAAKAGHPLEAVQAQVQALGQAQTPPMDGQALDARTLTTQALEAGHSPEAVQRMITDLTGMGILPPATPAAPLDARTLTAEALAAGHSPETIQTLITDLTGMGILPAPAAPLDARTLTKEALAAGHPPEAVQRMIEDLTGMGILPAAEPVLPAPLDARTLTEQALAAGHPPEAVQRMIEDLTGMGILPAVTTSTSSASSASSASAPESGPPTWDNSTIVDPRTFQTDRQWEAMAEAVLERVAARGSTFSKTEIQREAARVSPNGWDPKEVGGWVDRMTNTVLQSDACLQVSWDGVTSFADEELMGIAHTTGRPGMEFFTTRDAMAIENAITDRAVGALDAGAGLVSTETLNQTMYEAHASDGLILTEGQTLAVDGLTSSGFGIEVLDVPTGPSKNLVVGRAAKTWRADGQRVIVISPQAGGASVLAEKTGTDVGSCSVGQALARWDAADTVHSAARANGDHAITRSGHVDGEVDQNPWRVDSRTVIVVDHASGLTRDQLDALTLRATKVHAKLVLLGDTSALSPSKSTTGMFRSVKDAIGGGRTMDVEVMDGRQQWEATALQNLRDGHPDGLGAYEAAGRLHSAVDRETGISEAATRYQDGVAAGERTVIVASDRETCHAVNDAIAEHLHSGMEALDVHHFGDRAYAVGDVLLLRSTDTRIKYGLTEGKHGLAATEKDLTTAYNKLRTYHEKKGDAWKQMSKTNHRSVVKARIAILETRISQTGNRIDELKDQIAVLRAERELAPFVRAGSRATITSIGDFGQTTVTELLPDGSAGQKIVLPAGYLRQSADHGWAMSVPDATRSGVEADVSVLVGSVERGLRREGVYGGLSVGARGSAILWDEPREDDENLGFEIDHRGVRWSAAEQATFKAALREPAKAAEARMKAQRAAQKARERTAVRTADASKAQVKPVTPAKPASSTQDGQTPKTRTAHAILTQAMKRSAADVSVSERKTMLAQERKQGDVGRMRAVAGRAETLDEIAGRKQALTERAIADTPQPVIEADEGVVYSLTQALADVPGGDEVAAALTAQGGWGATIAGLQASSHDMSAEGTRALLVAAVQDRPLDLTRPIGPVLDHRLRGPQTGNAQQRVTAAEQELRRWTVRVGQMEAGGRDATKEEGLRDQAAKTVVVARQHAVSANPLHGANPVKIALDADFDKRYAHRLDRDTVQAIKTGSLSPSIGRSPADNPAAGPTDLGKIKTAQGQWFAAARADTEYKALWTQRGPQRPEPTVMLPKQVNAKKALTAATSLAQTAGTSITAMAHRLTQGITRGGGLGF